MNTTEDKFKVYLKRRRLKFTPERRTILEGVLALHRHFDVDQLYEKLRKQGRHLSRATIYRTLPLLVKSNLIRETLGSQEKGSYEHVFGHEHHDHLLCIKCGKVIEFKEEEIENLQKRVCNKYGFKALEHKLGIEGYCKNCR